MTELNPKGPLKKNLKKYLKWITVGKIDDCKCEVPIAQE